jgi:hypothetical protein
MGKGVTLNDEEARALWILLSGAFGDEESER